MEHNANYAHSIIPEHYLLRVQYIYYQLHSKSGYASKLQLREDSTHKRKQIWRQHVLDKVT